MTTYDPPPIDGGDRPPVRCTLCRELIVPGETTSPSGARHSACRVDRDALRVLTVAAYVMPGVLWSADPDDLQRIVALRRSERDGLVLGGGHIAKAASAHIGRYLEAVQPAHVEALLDELDSVQWLIAVQPCEVVHEEPFDFDQCRTHDKTFERGGTCPIAGTSVWDHVQDEEQRQRGRAVVAEMRAEAAEERARAAEQALRDLRSGGAGG